MGDYLYKPTLEHNMHDNSRAYNFHAEYKNVYNLLNVHDVINTNDGRFFSLRRQWEEGLPLHPTTQHLNISLQTTYAKYTAYFQ